MMICQCRYPVVSPDSNCPLMKLTSSGRGPVGQKSRSGIVAHHIRPDILQASDDLQGFPSFYSFVFFRFVFLVVGCGEIRINYV